MLCHRGTENTEVLATKNANNTKVKKLIKLAGKNHGLIHKDFAPFAFFAAKAVPTKLVTRCWTRITLRFIQATMLEKYLPQRAQSTQRF